MSLLGWLRRAAALPHWVRIAVQGALAPMVASGSLEIVQGVVEGEAGVLLAVRWELRGWELPGGSVDPGESDAEALRREIAEEVGVEVAVGALVGEYVRTGFYSHTARVYRCRHVAGTPAPSDESWAVGWFPVDAPPEGLLPWCRRPLRDAATGGAPVHREEHLGLAEILETMRADLGARSRGPARDPGP